MNYITFTPTTSAEDALPETEDYVKVVNRFMHGDYGVYPDALSDICREIGVENQPARDGHYTVAVYPEYGGIVVTYSEEDDCENGYVGTLNETIMNAKSVYDCASDSEDTLRMYAAFTVCVLYRARSLAEQLQEEGESD